MMRLFSAHHAETALVADIGGGGSAVAFLQLASGSPSRILASARRFTPLEERSADQSITQISQSLAEAAEAARKNYSTAGYKRAPKEIVAIVHAPWASSRTAEAERSFDHETRITPALISELAKEALATAHLARADMLEAGVAHVELNGYPSHAPEKHSAHHIKVVVLLSEMRSADRGALEHSLQTFTGIPVRFCSQARALASLLSQEGDSRNAVVIDMADDASSVTVIRKQVISEQARIPAGIHALLSKIAAAGSREETLALIGMLERGACQSAECERIVKALAAAEPEITKLFGEAFTALAAKRRLPNDAFLITDADLSGWFAQFLSRIDFAQFTTTSRPLSVHTLAPQDLAKYAIGDHLTDVSLLIAATLVHIEHGR